MLCYGSELIGSGMIGCVAVMVPPFFCFSTQLTTSIDVSSSAVLHSIMPPMARWSQSARYSGLYHYMLLANSEMRLQVASTGEKSRFRPHPPAKFRVPWPGRRFRQQHRSVASPRQQTFLTSETSRAWPKPWGRTLRWRNAMSAKAKPKLRPHGTACFARTTRRQLWRWQSIT
jgi:hypothetical protein